MNRLNLNENDISGPVPESIYDLPILSVAGFAENRLTSWPSAKGRTFVVRHLNLAGNPIRADINDLVSTANDYYIDISDTCVYGTISAKTVVDTCSFANSFLYGQNRPSAGCP